MKTIVGIGMAAAVGLAHDLPARDMAIEKAWQEGFEDQGAGRHSCVEAADLVSHLITTLRGMCRVYAWAVFGEGMTPAEVAKLYDVTEEAVQQQLRWAVIAMRNTAMAELRRADSDHPTSAIALARKASGELLRSVASGAVFHPRLRKDMARAKLRAKLCKRRWESPPKSMLNA